MDYLINEDIIQHINNGVFSVEEIDALIDIRDFINRTASKEYIDNGKLESLKERFGTSPVVTTWGDYFQTEIAYNKVNGIIENVQSAVETVKFDIMSCHVIFSQKGISFHEWVESRFETAMTGMALMREEDVEEAVHLKILKDYYVSLGVTGVFTAAEEMWYNAYKEDVAV
ncbi:MAG TPA: hypothetical protein PK253_18725 [Spirochaetota bacterium]|nr:hypothetical protein [Spirochaetota bacterium]